jgi:fatty acid desaturase/rubredoxin
MDVNRVDWFRVPLPQEELEDLNRPSDARGLLQAGGHVLLMAMTAASAVMAWQQASWGWLLVALYAHGTVCAFMINAVHELVHGTVFRTRWLNQLFVHFFAFVGWINHYAYWASHSEHHKFTLHEVHDGEVVLPVRFRFRTFVAAFTIEPARLWAVIYESFRLAQGQIDDPWLRRVLQGQQRRFAVFRWARAMLFGHLAIALVSLWQGWWIVPVIVSLTPMYGRGLFSLLNNTQHAGLAANAEDFRLNSRSIDVNPLFRFLYWNMNYHIEHHMYAAVPCYRLPALSRRMADCLPAPPRGIIAAWYHIIAVLYRQAQEPGYIYKPPIPGTAGENPATPQAATTVASAPPAGPANASTVPSRAWQCRVCGFTYYEALGLPGEGIAPGTPWDMIPDDWRCPDCGMAKTKFRMVEIPATAAANG